MSRKQPWPFFLLSHDLLQAYSLKKYMAVPCPLVLEGCNNILLTTTGISVEIL